MAFPLSPTNGQTSVLNNITYSYSTSTQAWTRVLSTGTISASGTGTTTTFVISNLTQTSSTNSGALQVYGGVGIGGGLFVGGTITATNITVNGYAVSTGTSSTAASGTGTTTTFVISNLTQSTGTNSGALQVYGGVGVGGNLYAGTVNAGATSGEYLQLSGANLPASASNIPSIFSLGSSTTYMVLGVNGAGYIAFSGSGANSAEVFRINAANASGSTNRLEVTASASGSGPILSAAGGTSSSDANIDINITPKGTGRVVVTGTATSISTTTGALVVTGGAGIGQDLYVGGTVTATNFLLNGYQVSTGTTLNGAASSVSIQYTLTNASFYPVFVSANSSTPTALPEYTTSTFSINPSTGVVTHNSTVAATSTNSGALQVVGGVGIGGDVYSSGNYYLGSNTRAVPTIYYSNSTVSQYSALLVQRGGVELWLAGANPSENYVIRNNALLDAVVVANTTGNVTLNSTQASASTTTGALVVKGGVGIGGGLIVGGTVTATNFVGAFAGTITGTASSATNLAGGTTGQIPYQSSPGVTGFTGPGSAGQVLVSNGAAAPTYSSNLTLNLFTASTIVVTSTQSSTSSFSANALYVAGGIGGNSGFNINGNGYLNGNLVVNGTVTGTNVTLNILSANSATFYGDSTGNGALYAGVTGYTPFAQTMIQATGNLNNYMEVNVQNINAGAKASTDIVASADNVTAAGAYIDMGITSSNWDGTQPNSLGQILTANDGYIMVGQNAIAGNGDLALGTTTTGTNIKFVVAATSATVLANQLAMSVNPVNSVANSTTTGVLVVYGGAGIGGSVYIGGTVTATNAVFNGTTPTTSTTTGALTVTGGVGIGGGLFVGGTITATNITVNGFAVSTSTTAASGTGTTTTFVISNLTQSTSTTTGALQVAGGVGIGKDVQIGGNLYVNNGTQVIPTNIQEFAATGGQTTFTPIGGYTVGTVQVTVNGISLGSSDFVASNGTTVVLNVPRNTSDVVRIISGGASSAVNNIKSFSIAMSIAMSM